MSAAPKTKGLFITGSDTDVGKTEITCGIARIWRKQGRSFAISKPIASGSPLGEGDAHKLAEAGGFSDATAISPITFADPVAPCVAARLRHEKLLFGDILSAIKRQGEGREGLLIEGVGGILCPLTESELVADLAKALDFPLLVVVRRSLGTLNHTLLTLEAARNRGLRVVGVIVNETRLPNSLAEETNVEELRVRSDAPVLAVVPYHEGGYSHIIPQLETIDWWSLAG